MPGKRLLWQLYPTYLLITLASLIAVGWYSIKSLEEFYYDRMREDLKARARLVVNQVQADFIAGNFTGHNELTRKLGSKGAMRVTLMLPSGIVPGESHEDPARMDNHASRPEMKEALSGRTGTSIRFSNTLKQKMLYLAVPVLDRTRVVGVVRTSIATEFIERELEFVKMRIALGGLLVALLAAGLSYVVSRRLSRPLEAMTQVANRFAKGDFDHRVQTTQTREIDDLGAALNQMARQLDERIRTVTAERNEREAMLFSMMEGVLAVDADERFISMNLAAAKLIGADLNEFHSRPLHEVVRNTDLKQFVRKALTSREVVESDIVLGSAEECCVQARGTVLRDEKDRAIGAVIVLNDVTRLRRLENVRKDFVANVSHELKTPITSIQGFVETLQEGAIHDSKNAASFLEIISRQVERLNAIIEDLLSLSRLEQDPERSEILFEQVQFKPLIQSAVQACQSKAAKRKTHIQVECDESLSASRINRPLLEQAIVNLVDNAIKYSQPESRVDVTAQQENAEIVIRVRDEGRGIGIEHLPRIFERFYRVDKARSRELGGTGLGLAIVKHIAQAHGGSVKVDSALGKGSTFSIHLPQN